MRFHKFDQQKFVMTVDNARYFIRVGNVTLLPWLATRLGPELDSALSDENKQGLTPITWAIKVIFMLI